MNRGAIEKDVLYQLYIVEGKSMGEIARELNLSVGKVFKYMKIHDIESRPQHKGFLGKTHGKEAREKISIAHKGKFVSVDTRRKIAESKKLNAAGHKKKREDGYITVYFPKHPSASSDGYVMEHRLIVENHIGRLLKDDEVVHHKNHNRSDNRIENLQLMTFKEHSRLHMIERWKEKKGEMTYQ